MRHSCGRKRACSVVILYCNWLSQVDLNNGVFWGAKEWLIVLRIRLEFSVSVVHICGHCPLDKHLFSIVWRFRPYNLQTIYLVLNSRDIGHWSNDERVSYHRSGLIHRKHWTIINWWHLGLLLCIVRMWRYKVFVCTYNWTYFVWDYVKSDLKGINPWRI